MLVENRDFVQCRECGFQASTLATHLKKHGLTADAYRAKHPQALIRAEALTEKRQAAAAQSHATKPRAGLKKTILCSSCDAPREVGYTFAASVHDTRCPECRGRDVEEFWALKEEGLDYVICQICGYRAESLVSHLQNAHPDMAYEGEVMSQRCGTRDKSYLKGQALSQDTRAKMSANAGRWNAGLTKETDPRVARMGARPDDFVSHFKGLTKETSDVVRQRGAALSETRKVQHWTNGTEVSLTREQLLPFRLKNGKVSVGKAIAALGHAFVTIRRECEKHGMPISHTAIQQAICLEMVSRILGGASYEVEWSDPRFTNPKTGRRFRFDGYFPSHQLLVEFHGVQHWLFPSTYVTEREEFDALQARDKAKVELAKASGMQLFSVREDEPYADESFLRNRISSEVLSFQKSDLLKTQ
jgi:Zn ribbon nucleic-acid-binding protein